MVKSFITLAPGVHFIKLFFSVLYAPWQLNLSQNLRQYANSGKNYAKKVSRNWPQGATTLSISALIETLS